MSKTSLDLIKQRRLHHFWWARINPESWNTESRKGKAFAFCACDMKRESSPGASRSPCHDGDRMKEYCSAWQHVVTPAVYSTLPAHCKAHKEASALLLFLPGKSRTQTLPQETSLTAGWDPSLACYWGNRGNQEVKPGMLAGCSKMRKKSKYLPREHHHSIMQWF